MIPFKTDRELTVDQLKAVLSYNPETGIFTRIRTGKPSGKVYPKSFGYVHIGVGNYIFSAHRLAWLYMTGKHAPTAIDHINRVRDDNRWCNLRLATTMQNGANMSLSVRNKTGKQGICWCKRANKYKTYIRFNYKLIHLGYFEHLDDAVNARKKAEEIYFGTYASDV